MHFHTLIVILSIKFHTFYNIIMSLIKFVSTDYKKMRFIIFNLLNILRNQNQTEVITPSGGTVTVIDPTTNTSQDHGTKTRDPNATTLTNHDHSTTIVPFDTTFKGPGITTTIKIKNPTNIDSTATKTGH